MADRLLRVLWNLEGTPAKAKQVLVVPSTNFDKCVVINVGLVNNGTAPDQVWLRLKTADAPQRVITLIPGQPVGVNDAFWGKPDISFPLMAGDELWVESTNPGQNIDVIIGYLLSDTI